MDEFASILKLLVLLLIVSIPGCAPSYTKVSVTIRDADTLEPIEGATAGSGVYFYGFAKRYGAVDYKRSDTRSNESGDMTIWVSVKHRDTVGFIHDLYEPTYAPCYYLITSRFPENMQSPKYLFPRIEHDRYVVLLQRKNSVQAEE